jgi:hypothetical protein
VKCITNDSTCHRYFGSRRISQKRTSITGGGAVWGAGVDLMGVQVDSHNSDSVVVEHSRDIFGGEFVCCIADEKTSLSNSTVTNDDAPV